MVGNQNLWVLGFWLSPQHRECIGYHALGTHTWCFSEWRKKDLQQPAIDQAPEVCALPVICNESAKFLDQLWNRAADISPKHRYFLAVIEHKSSLRHRSTTSVKRPFLSMNTSFKAVIASLITASALTSPNAFAQAKKLTIGLAVANLNSDFFNQIKQSVEAAAKKKGIEVITVDAQGDGAKQAIQVQQLIGRKVDALIYIPAGATAAGVPVKAAKAAGIPVVAVDRNAPDAPGDTFIATDSVAAARMLGEYVIKLTGGKGAIAIIQGQVGTTPELDRDRGFSEAIAKAPGLKVVAKQPSNAWGQDEGFKIGHDMLKRDPGITVFFGRADALALGAAQAVKVASLDHRIVVVGFDGDIAGLKAVRSGVLDATMTQRTQAMGRLSLDAALDLIAGKKLAPVQLQPATLTTKENVDQYIAEHP